MLRRLTLNCTCIVSLSTKSWFQNDNVNRIALNGILNTCNGRFSKGGEFFLVIFHLYGLFVRIIS
jgi:hypothetical protein